VYCFVASTNYATAQDSDRIVTVKKDNPTTNDGEFDNRLQRISETFQDALNIHGFSYQQAILRRSSELRATGSIPWYLYGSELPVRCRSETTHVDVVYQYSGDGFERTFDYFLVCECKRVNPAKGRWCFSKTKYDWFNHRSSQIQFDKVYCIREDAASFLSSTKSLVSEFAGVYNLGLEIKTDEKGDAYGAQPKSAIDDAVGQLLKSSSGVINYFTNHGNSFNGSHVLKKGRPALFIPVLFTTARIFVTEAELGSASLETGYLPPNHVKLKETDWIWLNVNRGTHLAHDVKFQYSDPEEASRNHSFRKFTRSIAIVGPDGIDNFLNTRFTDWFE
jgi:hypothetical protein